MVVPFCHPRHDYPKDSWRFSPEGLKILYRDFELRSSDWRTGPTATILAFMLEFVKNIFPSPCLVRACHFLLGWLLFPCRYLDALFLKREDALRLGNHHYAYLRKPQGS